MAELYGSQTDPIAARLAHAIADDNRRVIVARLLAMAVSWGAGDALAGYLLRGVPLEHLEAAAMLLKLDRLPRCGGMSGALMMLDSKSVDPVIMDLLAELRCRSASGGG